ncbi:hypothetical protein [Ferrimonas marina]|uniref:Uncharacterized protein n=1 Tax=Ferrimonas marina TaxID=299255 RepID=A0A1M5NTN3_9GAMM|nr:hypothetical protein [Ferrimonas marina]SHG92926.1 hypothetical protein SAMN02745129_1176 [Ferrimonas marina]
MKRSFRSELDLTSLVKILGVCGFGTGAVVGAVTLLAMVLLHANESGMEELVGALLMPLTGFFYGVLNALIGYPFYRWWCARRHGQRVQGLFVEVEPPGSGGPNKADP